MGHENDTDREWRTRVDRTLFGNGELGIVQQNRIMWRIHVWVLCTMSGAAGVFGTLIIQKMFK